MNVVYFSWIEFYGITAIRHAAQLLKYCDSCRLMAVFNFPYIPILRQLALLICGRQN